MHVGTVIAMKSNKGVTPRPEQPAVETSEPSSHSSRGEQSTSKQASREEGGEGQLDQTAAYYDKIYFDSSSSEEDGGGGGGGGGGERVR